MNDNLAKALKTDMSDPFGIYSSRQKAQEQEDVYKQASAEEETARRAMAEKKKPLYERVQSSLATQKAQEMPTLEPLPTAPTAKIDPQQLNEAMQSFMAFALLGGALTKQPMLSAINNMTGAMEGYMKGNKEQFEQQIKEFDKNYKLAEAKNTQLLNKYKLIKEKNQGDVQAMMTELELAAQEGGDDISVALAKKGDAKGLMTHHDSIAKGGMQAKASADRLSLLYSKQEEKKEDKQREIRDADEMASYVANYAMAPPALRDKNRYEIMKRVMQINPNYHESDYKSKGVAYTNWTNPNGAGAKQITAFGTLTAHLQTLDNLATAMQQNDIPLVNSIVNTVKTGTGDPTVTNFETAKKAVGTEFVKAIAGTAGGVREREEAQRLFDAAKSPEQLKGAIRTAQDLVGGRLQVIEQQYETSTGRKDFLNLLPPNAKKTFSGYVAEPVEDSAPSTDAGWTNQKEKRYQELLKKQSAGD